MTTEKDKQKDKIIEELDELHLQINELGEFIRILMIGHKTERMHKNIFNKMLTALKHISEHRFKRKEKNNDI